MSEPDSRREVRLGVKEMADAFHSVMNAWNERDYDRLFTLVGDDLTLSTDPAWPGGGEFHRREEIEPFIEEFDDPWDQVRYEALSEPSEVNGRLIERGAWSGRGRASRIAGKIEFSAVVAFDGGLPSRLNVFFEHDDALDFARDQD